MALHSAVKGKLISVIGDEVITIVPNVYSVGLISDLLFAGHLCWIPFGRNWGDQQKSSSKLLSR